MCIRDRVKEAQELNKQVCGNCYNYAYDGFVFVDELGERMRAKDVYKRQIVGIRQTQPLQVHVPNEKLRRGAPAPLIFLVEGYVAREVPGDQAA